jgi:uncharacterized membrane protein YdfJ with MMPL/SSD domain
MAWTTARKNRARDNAEAWGDLQRFVMASPLFPFVVVVVGLAVMALGIGWLEHNL